MDCIPSNIVYIIASIIFIIGTTLVDLLTIIFIKNTIKDIQEFGLSEISTIECILILFYACMSILLTIFTVRVIYLFICSFFI